MGAVLSKEIREPTGLGHEQLTEWAGFARDSAETFHSWAVKPRVDKGYDGDPPDRWFVVNRIIGNLKRDADNFWPVVSRYYLGEMPLWLMERELNRSQHSLLVSLNWACELVRREYLDVVC